MLCVAAPTVDGEQTVLQFACRDHGKVWGNKGLQSAHDLIDFVSGIMEARRAKSSFAEQSARSDAMLAMSDAARLGAGSSRSEMFKEFLALLCEHLECTACALWLLPQPTHPTEKLCTMQTEKITYLVETGEVWSRWIAQADCQR